MIECGGSCERTRPVRKRMNHRGPLSIDVSGAWYFVTICSKGHAPWTMAGTGYGDTDDTVGRARSPNAPPTPSFDEIARVILWHAREYHEMGKWRLSLFLVMPDHLHFIVHAPTGCGAADDGAFGERALPVGVCDNDTDVGRAGAPRTPQRMDGTSQRMRTSDKSAAPSLPRLIGNWKRWLTTNFGIGFQKNFFDTRIRDAAHYAEKFRYVCNNPVRKGLCRTARDWPHVIAFDRESGVERAHRGGGTADAAGVCDKGTDGGRARSPNAPQRTHPTYALGAAARSANAPYRGR